MYISSLGKKNMILQQKIILATLQLYNRLQVLISFLSGYLKDMIGFAGKVRHFNKGSIRNFAMFVTG